MKNEKKPNKKKSVMNAVYITMIIAPLVIWSLAFDFFDNLTVGILSFKFINSLLTSVLVTGLFGLITIHVINRDEKKEFDKINAQISSIHDIIDRGEYNVKYDKISKDQKLDDWAKAEKTFFINLTSGVSYGGDSRLEEVVKNKNLADVKIMLTHPDYSKELAKIFKIEEEDFTSDIKKWVKKFWKIKQETDSGKNKKFEIKLMKFMPYSSFSCVDKDEPTGRFIVTHYSYGTGGSGDSPSVKIDRNTKDNWYRKYCDVIDRMWNSKDAIEVNEQTLKGELKEYFPNIFE